MTLYCSMSKKYPSVSIPSHSPHDTQLSQIGKEYWSVSRLIYLTRDFPVFDIPLMALNLSDDIAEDMTLRAFVGHMKAVQDADPDCPIILDQDGQIMDGRHRIGKALLLEHSTIKAVRFAENPSPCGIEDDSE